jgi:thiaminase
MRDSIGFCIFFAFLVSFLGLAKSQLSCAMNQEPTGYCYIQFYANTGCTGDLTYAEGSATGVCVSQYHTASRDNGQQNPFFQSFKQFYNTSTFELVVRQTSNGF